MFLSRTHNWSLGTADGSLVVVVVYAARCRDDLLLSLHSLTETTQKYVRENALRPLPVATELTLDLTHEQ